MADKELCIAIKCPYFVEFSEELIGILADTRYPLKEGEGTCSLDITQEKLSEGSVCLSPEDKRESLSY